MGKSHSKPRSISIKAVDMNAAAVAQPKPMPPVEELNELFEAVLVDLNLPPEKMEQMRQFPNDRKWIIVQSNSKQENVVEVTDEEIQREIASVKNNPTTELLQSMSVSLRSRPIRWVSKFAEHEGIAALLNYLRDMPERAKDEGHEELVVRCLKSLMNNPVRDLPAYVSHVPMLINILLEIDWSCPSFE